LETLFLERLPTPIGKLQLVASKKGLVYLGFANKIDADLLAWSRRAAPNAKFVLCADDFAEVGQQVMEFLDGRRTHFDAALDLRCSSFQQKVYRELAKIPYCTTRSYGEIARALDKPGAARAVGNACGANPLPLFIPCHRVVAANGRLGGFGGGLALKRRLLELERKGSRS